MAAIVLNAKGTIEIRAAGSPSFHTLTAATQPRAGDVIRTGAEARLRLALLPNALIQLRDSSELEIVALVVAKDGDETDRTLTKRQASVRLNSGRFYAVHEQRDDAAIQFIVATPHGKLVADSVCLYRIEVDEDRTRVSCARGVAKFYAAGDKTPAPISAGQIGCWPSETGENITSAADQRSKGELENARRIENDLLVGRAGIRNVLPH